MINEYQIKGKLGEGGMGSVYEGVQPVIGKRVAIKVLLREYASNAEVVNRFIQEARAANQAQSRYIVDIFSFGELCDGRHYFVMEYLAGKSLREVLDEHKVMPFDEAYAILSSVAKGLAAAHAVGIIHRDIKPENLVVIKEQDGSTSAKVLDFGIAKLQGNQANPSFVTKTGAALGTPYYMSPEQCRGQDVDHRTDIYALGIITYEMFSGSLPYKAGSYIELVNKHLFASPPPPSDLNPEISSQLEAFILRCIAKNPDERPQSMKQFRSELAELVPSLHKTRPSAAHSIPAVTPDTRGTTDALETKPKGKLGLVLGILGLVLVILGGGGVGAYLWYAKQRAGLSKPVTKGGADTHRGAEAGQGTAVVVAKKDGTVAKAADSAASASPAGADSAAPAHKKTARLVVKTGNRRAIYYLNGTRVGKGMTLTLDEHPAGTYTLKIVARRYATRIEEITLRPGIEKNLELQLRRRGGRRPPEKKTQQQKKPANEDPEATLDPFKKKK
jgi:tRNA A-37 threonylcarbamoyl transferase component Bud32